MTGRETLPCDPVQHMCSISNQTSPPDKQRDRRDLEELRIALAKLADELEEQKPEDSDLDPV